MSRFKIKALSVCFELLWWGGLVGLIVELFTGGLSIGVLSLWAIGVSVRFFCSINRMNISLLLRLVQKYRDER